jgi:hypothetical protein
VEDLLMAVPSRGRPHNIARLWQAMQDTCTADTTLLAGLDEDDPSAQAYPAGPAYVIRPGLRYVTAWVNELAVPRAQDYLAIGHFGDDNVPVTPGWDTAMLRALGRTPFAFANDQYPSREPGTLCCHVFMRSEVTRTLGYFGPPSISHMYVDVAWMAWGKACGITYLHDVLIPHRHYTTGASQLDETYARSCARTSEDLQAWHAYCRSGGLNDDIGKLDGRPYTPETLAEFNRALNIPQRWPG